MAGALLCLSLNVNAQSINMHMQSVSVKKAITELQEKSGYSFVYIAGEIDTNKTVTINAKDLNEAIKQILKGQDLSYEIKGKNIIIKKSSETKVKHSDKKIQVKGSVKDAKGEPVIGATVMEKGSTNGTITDFDGNFILNVTEGSSVEISYIGFEPQQFNAVEGKDMAVVLKEDTELLDEVVVVGYGSQKKINLTGSVATVGHEDLAERPVTNITAAIQGAVPGMTITSGQGRPGQDAGSIRVRGTGTLNNSDPYILVDGIETETMNSIDANDIESISVLKDAASAAIYGSKAANGVILITTKRGKEGKPIISYSGNFGWQKPTGTIERVNSADAAILYNKALEDDNKSPRFTETDIKLFRDGTDPYGHPNTNWNDLAFQGNGFMHKHNINISGGSTNVKYMASIGYQHQNGIMVNSNREQFNLRTNLDVKMTDKLNMKVNMAFIHNDYDDPTNSYTGGGSDQIIRQVNRIAPWIPYKNEDGTYGTIGDGNPIAWLDLDQVVSRKNKNFSGTIAFDYDINSDIKITAQGSYISNIQDYKDFVKEIQYNSSKYHGPTSLDKRIYQWERYNFDLLANYGHSFNKHNIKGLLGYHIEKFSKDETIVSRENFPNNDLTDINAGAASTQKNSGFTRDLAMMSYFARINYDYNGKYLFEANFRADASSRFSKENRWGYFPSVSAAWRISEESFMESTKKWLDSLKIRGSWGQLGNQDALDDYYPWMVTYAIGSNYPFNGITNTGITQKYQKLESISWETTTNWGIGIEASILSCLDFSIEYYNRLTRNIIMDVLVPGTFGLGAYKDNVGKMKNTGIEITTSFHKQWNDFKFNVSGNLAINHNEIVDLGIGGDKISDYYINRVGEAYNSFYGYIADGFFQSQDEADEFTQKYGNPFGKKFKAGDIRYKDANKDGKLNADDRCVTGAELPNITFGANIGLSWKNFDFAVLLQGAADVKRYFTTEVYGEISGDDGHPATTWLDAWSEDNKNASFPRVALSGTSASSPSNYSSFWIQSANYLRIKNIQFGYTLPKKWIKNCGITNAKIYYSGENLFCFDSLPIDIDPEAPSGRGSHYPQVSTHSIGINLTF